MGVACVKRDERETRRNADSDVEEYMMADITI